MKKIILIFGLLFTGTFAIAQRTPVANFSQFQQYFNPALTGNEGSAIKGFYRDQFEAGSGAPTTLFMAAELKLTDLIKKNAETASYAHAVGLSLLNDEYGAAKNNRASLSYSLGYQLKKFRIHAGIAATVDNTKFSFDEALVFDEEDTHDFENVNKLGINAGLAISSDNFYAGYALSDIVEENLSNDGKYLNDLYPVQHIAQLGYRRQLGQPFAVVINGIFRYDKAQKESVEGQLKAVYKNAFWLGAGYRHDLAYTFNAGIRFERLKLSYSREVRSSHTAALYKGNNEITLALDFRKISAGQLSIW